MGYSGPMTAPHPLLNAADVPRWAHDRIRSSVTVPRHHRAVRERYDALLAEINALG